MVKRITRVVAVSMSEETLAMLNQLALNGDRSRFICGLIAEEYSEKMGDIKEY